MLKLAFRPKNHVMFEIVTFRASLRLLFFKNYSNWRALEALSKIVVVAPWDGQEFAAPRS